jgi:hypothetical protein
MLRALIYAIVECGFEPRIATEIDDSGEERIKKIKDLIKNSQYSIHDISRMEQHHNPRFNLPFEVGFDLGCREFGEGEVKKKRCLILDREKYRFKKFLSDLSGSDIHEHSDEPRLLIREVRNWLRTNTGMMLDDKGPNRIWTRFVESYSGYVNWKKSLGFSDEDIEELPVSEYIAYIRAWIDKNPF